jgi:peptidoglycan/LPS O-acetylase OafA/YrhL
LRGLAIIGVVVVHCSLYGDNENLPLLFQSFAHSGMFGVQLFFMVSAFTLFLSLDNRRHEEEFVWQGFFIRRFFRVAPMYYLGILYFLLQDGFGPRYFLCDTGHITGANILSNFLFVHGLYPFWISSLVPGGWSFAVYIYP